MWFSPLTPRRLPEQFGEPCEACLPADAGVRARLAAGRLDAPDVVLTGRPDAVVGLIAGALRPAEAAAHGVSVTGDARRLSRLRPRHLETFV